MDEQFKKDYAPVVEFIIENYKKYVDGNFSLKRNALLQDIKYKFQKLDANDLKNFSEQICLRIEIDALAAGRIIKNMDIKLKH